jgi:endonuclease/exonuclease/phosphatase family metal-dependent hydrolase
MSPIRSGFIIGALLLGLAAQPGLAQPPAELSVLTYNIEGLPWPARSGRAEDLSRIADQLQSLRAEGHQPHVVLFEEAFSADARAVPVKAGYRYIVDGPAASDAGARPTSPADRAFAAAARFLSGEKWGKLRGSGLRIASDYPILDVKRMPYPTYACAGMDCLANKGVVLVTIAVPGAPQPVAIVATHLNSRRAARVPIERSFYAYQRQVDALSDFVRANIAPGMPFIVAGDFNAGQEPQRRAYLLQRAAGWRADAPVQAALDTCLEAADLCPADNRDDLAFSQRRGRDWQLFASGGSERLRLKSMAALFGHNADGHMLSDHVGYAATYALDNGPSTPTALSADAGTDALGAERQPVALAVRDQLAARQGGAPR